MTNPTTESLVQKRCVPCEGGVPMIDRDSAVGFLAATPGWTIDDDGKAIFRKVNCGNFVKAMKLLQSIAEVAEAEQHHPDLHLTGYRHVRIDMTTHAIGGLSENDFIVAAKINQLLGDSSTTA
ncbi:MAG: 4a-hydroxytetrahydrobiopterin dehydratase [Rubripirellula sp.]